MKLSQVAAQLYTCRNLLKTPAEITVTLRRLRAAGYTAVQISGVGPIADDELNRILDGEGLVCCATHDSASRILDEPEKVVEKLKNLRCSYTAYPFPGSMDFGNPSVVEEFCRKLNAAGKVLAEAGQTLCYHNHAHEFRKLGGRTVLDIIYAETDPKYLQAEPDTYWIQIGGGDNVEWCEKLSGRLPLIHLKDYMVTEENKPTFCEIGSGNLNFKKIIAAAEKSGCQWFIVEQDTCPGDPVDSLAQSFDFIAANLVS